MMQNVSMPRVCYTANYPDLYQLQIIKMSHELLILVVQHGIISLSGLTAFSYLVMWIRTRFLKH